METFLPIKGIFGTVFFTVFEMILVICVFTIIVGTIMLVKEIFKKNEE